MQNRIAEIRDYLAHDDYSLAIRRILDTSLDTGDLPTIRESINLSRSFKDLNADSFNERVDEFLGKLTVFSTSYVGNHQQVLIASHISKTYKSGAFKLHPINLNLITGNILGVVGPNGNGKTTLLRCIAGQLALDTGEIDYPRMVDPDNFTIKQKIAFIPQRIPRWYGRLKDNLHFSAALSGVKGEENEVMVDFMLERLNLSQYAHLNWEQISSGYRTRFEFARILLQKPTLLILDEPLANLDVNAQQTILTDLRYMAKSLHNPMGVILSSQQLHEVEKVADDVLLIKEGKCLYRTGDGTTAGTHVLELETTIDRDRLAQILGENVQIQFNGGFYTITSTGSNVQEMISKLIDEEVPVTYLRDITHSTKRFI